MGNAQTIHAPFAMRYLFRSLSRNDKQVADDSEFSEKYA